MIEEPPKFTRKDIKKMVSKLPTKERVKKAMYGEKMSDYELSQLISLHPEIKNGK